MVILDGGMGRQLADNGAPFRQPEWSALALIEQPQQVANVHQQFIEAGAQLITTNTYAVVPFHIGQQRFDEQGLELIELAARLARRSADAAKNKVAVAGCVPPLFGSYLPHLFDADKADNMFGLFKQAQADYVDLYLAETYSSWQEIDAFLNAFAGVPQPIWVSCSIEDSDIDPSTARLRSKEPVSDIIERIMAHSNRPEAILFNCSQPEVMAQAIKVARRLLPADYPIGVYANGLPAKNPNSEANAEHSQIRADLTPESYLDYVTDWINDGVTLIGGCCGIGPQHIRVLTDSFAESK